MNDETRNWYDYYNQAKTFWDMAMKVTDNPGLFTSTEAYLLTAVAVEKFLMTFMVYHDFFPINYGLSDLVSLLDRKGIVWKELFDAVRKFERFHTICLTSDGRDMNFSQRDIDFFMDVGRSVVDFAESYFHEDFKSFRMMEDGQDVSG